MATLQAALIVANDTLMSAEDAADVAFATAQNVDNMQWITDVMPAATTYWSTMSSNALAQ